MQDPAYQLPSAAALLRAVPQPGPGQAQVQSWHLKREEEHHAGLEHQQTGLHRRMNITTSGRITGFGQ